MYVGRLSVGHFYNTPPVVWFTMYYVEIFKMTVEGMFNLDWTMT